MPIKKAGKAGGPRLHRCTPGSCLQSLAPRFPSVSICMQETLAFLQRCVLWASAFPLTEMHHEFSWGVSVRGNVSRHLHGLRNLFGNFCVVQDSVPQASGADDECRQLWAARVSCHKANRCLLLNSSTN